MYSYMFYGYVAYKVYEYVDIIGRSVTTAVGIYRWISPSKKVYINNESYTDWILVSD